jgi:hypothetical protein
MIPGSDNAPKKVVSVRKFDQSFLRDLLSANSNSSDHRPTPSDDLPVSPTLASGAHLVWQEGDACVYLGPARSAREPGVLGVGAVVNCTKRVPCHHRGSVLYSQVAVNDAPAADILTYLPGATSFMKNCLSSSKSVLVHCEAGVSRSATVVIAYLMRYHNMTRDEAYIHVKSRRPINPNEGFWRQLEVYESQLAQKDVETEATTKDSLVDSVWAKESSATFLLCRDTLSDAVITDHCFARIIKGKKVNTSEVLFVCLDYIWGRGIILAEVEWLAAACTVLKEECDYVALVKCMLTTKSKFTDQWVGEVSLEQVERVIESLQNYKK